jgi:hypothetical protein
VLGLANINVNLEDIDGNTPIMHAVDREMEIKYLKLLCAKPTIDLKKKYFLA